MLLYGEERRSARIKLSGRQVFVDIHRVSAYFSCMDKLTVLETIARYGLSESTVRRYIKNGRVASCLVKGVRYISEESLEALQAEQEIQEHEKPAPAPRFEPGHDPTLDQALEYMKDTALSLAKNISERVDSMAATQYDLPALVLAMQKTTDTMLKLVEIAPFLALRNKLESTELFRAWCRKNNMHQDIENALNDYQQHIIDESTESLPLN